MALNMFMPAVTGMEAQSHAMGQIGTNISNITTVGYKTNETMFQTLLGSSSVNSSGQSANFTSRTGIMGVGYDSRTNLSQHVKVSASGVA